MGKNTGKSKSGRELHPMDAFRKQMKEKDIKRNKREKEENHEIGLMKKSPEVIKATLDKLRQLDNMGKLNASFKKKKALLERVWEKVSVRSEAQQALKRALPNEFEEEDLAYEEELREQAQNAKKRRQGDSEDDDDMSDSSDQSSDGEDEDEEAEGEGGGRQGGRASAASASGSSGIPTDFRNWNPENPVIPPPPPPDLPPEDEDSFQPPPLSQWANLHCREASPPMLPGSSPGHRTCPPTCRAPADPCSNSPSCDHQEDQTTRT